MITAEQLYAATNDGLAIIALHHPEAENAARTGKPFKARPSERTPSANVRLYPPKGQRSFPLWQLTDFGGEGRAISPIQLHMDATGLRFNEAVLDLAQMFGVNDNINRAINKPDIRKEPAKADQAIGDCWWELTDEFTERQCKIMGPKATPETLQSLHWYLAKSITHVNDKREAVTKLSTENYPIFMRECWYEDAAGKRERFYKIYEPLNPDKQWRFSYQPKGKKPQSYVNGLEELRQAWQKFNDEEEAAWNRDPINSERPYKEQKLECAIICSGERDAVCARSYGYHPLWFNSETYKPSDTEMKMIYRYVETVYNIPDIDTTGRSKGAELALRYIDVHTVWLPDKLRQRNDNRGKPRKDLRDYVEIYNDKRDFEMLLKLANPARFWKVIKKDTGITYKIDLECLFSFLNLNGFYTLKDEKRKDLVRFIKIEGTIVHNVTPKDIRAFLHTWASETAQPRDLRNLILSTPLLSAASLEALPQVELDFTNYTDHTQWFFFPDNAVEVKPGEIVVHDGRNSTLGRYVWEDDVIAHRIRIMPDMFTISHPEDSTASEDFSIEIHDITSNYFRYLINSSRLHWRKELETNQEGKTEADAAEYRKKYKFCIDGPDLTDDERAEQRRCLISRMFTIGYVCHRFKSPSRSWAPLLMDNLIGDGDECNGGSGKSFMFKALSNFIKYVKISGRNKKLLDSQFLFEQVDKCTDLVLIDDCDEYFPFKDFYDVITNDITINPKGTSMFNLRYEESPKFAFTTNYVPKDFDGSSVRRTLYGVAGDYYHQKTEMNDYRETRTIYDDFGKDLMSANYSEAEWEADINFVLQCVKFYLRFCRSNVKIEPALANIIYRKYLRDMSDNFREWAEGYFAPEYGHMDREIVREEAFQNYKQMTGTSKTTMQRFTKALKGFCYTNKYVDSLNPPELCNSGGRILRRVFDKISNRTESKEMIYVRSVMEADRLRAEATAPAPPSSTRANSEQEKMLF